jgi:hypothetical protein
VLRNKLGTKPIRAQLVCCQVKMWLARTAGDHFLNSMATDDAEASRSIKKDHPLRPFLAPLLGAADVVVGRKFDLKMRLPIRRH